MNDPPLTFAHRKHADNTTAGYSVSCSKCHYLTTSDGVTVTSRAEHLDRQSRVTFQTTDPLVASAAYTGTATTGDSGTTTGRCTNVYCHSTGNRLAPPFDNGAAGAPDAGSRLARSVSRVCRSRSPAKESPTSPMTKKAGTQA